MEYLVQLLSTLFGEQETVRMVFVVMIAMAIFAIVLAIMFVGVGVVDPVRRRIVEVTGPNASAKGGSAGVARALQSVSPYVLPKQGWERSRIQAKLVHAGCRSPNALTVFFGSKILLGVSLPLVTLFTVSWFPQLTAVQVIFALGVAGFAGIVLPNAVLHRLYEKRMRLLTHAFPDALDLLVVCVEAGLGLAAAIQRVADELAVSHPELAEELTLVNAEMRAGVERVEALRNLAERTGLEDIRGLVTLLAQSLRFGTSIAETLRVYSEEFRDKRMQRAEEQAAKIGTKMIFPLVFCMFPSFFLVAIGPAVMRIVAAFSGQ